MSSGQYWTVTAPIFRIYSSVYTGGPSEQGDNPNPTLYPVGEGGGGGSMPLDNLRCENLMQAQETAPDGAIYFLPRDVDQTYLRNALSYISEYSRSRTFEAVRDEIIRMYEVPAHPHFVDFKDWGTPDGPEGSLSVGTYDYYSNAIQAWVYNSPATEAFGNYFFSLVCTFGGFSQEATLAAASWSSWKKGGHILDDPQDRPHVQAGLAAAQRYLAQQESGTPEPVISFNLGCHQ